MTEQQIDRGHENVLRKDAAEHQPDNHGPGICGDPECFTTCVVDGCDWPCATAWLRDQLDQAEAELDSWMARTYEAEGKLWKAEIRLAGWMEHWNATARTGAVDEVAAILEANARADHAEARIKAVEDVLNRKLPPSARTLAAEVRHALGSDPPPSEMNS